MIPLASRDRSGEGDRNIRQTRIHDKQAGFDHPDRVDLHLLGNEYHLATELTALDVLGRQIFDFARFHQVCAGPDDEIDNRDQDDVGALFVISVWPDTWETESREPYQRKAHDEIIYLKIPDRFAKKRSRNAVQTSQSADACQWGNQRTEQSE
jgi:hypothetical protein